MRWLAMIWSAGRTLSTGRLTEAERLAFDARDLGRATGQTDADWFFAVNLAGIRYEQDRLEEVVDLFVEFEDSGQYGRGAAGAMVLLYAELDRPEETKRCLEKMAAPDFGDLPLNNVWLHFMCSAAPAAAALKDASRCRKLAAMLEPHADCMGGTGLFWLGSVSHYLGLLAAALGHFELAEQRFRAAEAFHDRIATPAWLARTRVEWARLLLMRRGHGDADRARQLLDQALATARTMGLANIERRATALLI
jgi:tetratricopeptide (TPR) repeat protein